MDRDGKSHSKWFVKLYALKFEKCFGIKNLQNKPRLTLKLVLLTFFSGLRSMKVLTFCCCCFSSISMFRLMEMKNMFHFVHRSKPLLVDWCSIHVKVLTLALVSR